MLKQSLRSSAMLNHLIISPTQHAVIVFYVYVLDGREC